MQCFFKKMAGGSLVPADDESAEYLAKLKIGTVLRGEFKQPRNYKFLQKTMVLFKMCFDYFAETMEDSHPEYRGIKAEPSFDYFRKNLIILAGHYDATFDIFGKVHLQAKSLSFGSCSEEEASRIYSDVINAALKHLYRGSMSEEDLNKAVNDLLSMS